MRPTPTPPTEPGGDERPATADRTGGRAAATEPPPTDDMKPADPAGERPPAPPRLPARRALLRFALLVLVVGGGFAALRWTPAAGWLDRESLIALFETLRRSWWAPAALVALYLVLSPLGVPVSPLVLAGGLVFGVGWGSVWNIVGTFLGGAVSYALARLLGRDFVVHFTGERLRRVERALGRRAFWPLVRMRFLPLPFAIVNYGAALAGIPAPLFLVSTAVGLAPSVLLYTYFAALVFRATADERGTAVAQGIVAFALVIALTYLPKWWVGRQRRRRYRELVAERRGRRRPSG